MHDAGIDLRLAVNYLPACVCVGKAGTLLACLGLVHVFQFTPGYVMLGLVLVVDRLQCPGRIFDGNSILLVLLFADAIYRLRETPSSWWHLWPAVWNGVGFAWAAFSLYVIVELPGTGQLRELRATFLLTGLFVSLASLCQTPEEWWLDRVGRGFAFTLLSLAWVYVVGIHHRRLARHRDSGVHFIVNFSPVLFIHPYMAALFAFVAAQCVAARMWRPSLSVGGWWSTSTHADAKTVVDESTAVVVTAATASAPAAEVDASGTSQSELEELQQMFLLAKMNNKGGV